ncbi:MAG: DUF1836 domain-containing protein [Oscillospiraceae bacterium]|nr:DUF1836 domain-containing protein [Oscillospiraceae bacterium]
MAYDKALVAGKLRRWETYLENFRLPDWEEIPDFGLYMEQVTALLKDYLDYLPPELKEEQFITAATINNYVRIKVMPEPIKRRYYRTHIAYLIIILTLKHSMSIALIQKLIPMDLSEEQIRTLYTDYVARHRKAALYFIDQIRLHAGPILDHELITENAIDSTESLIFSNAVLAGFSRLLAEKLLLLEGKDLNTGGSIERSGNSSRASGNKT